MSWKLDDNYFRTISEFTHPVQNTYIFTNIGTSVYQKDGVVSVAGRMEVNMLNKEHYEIEKVIINEPATIIIWKDKTKTVVKCGENDDFSPEAGIALAYMKHCMFDDKTTQFNKWMNKQTSDYYDSICNSCFDRLMNKVKL